MERAAVRFTRRAVRGALGVSDTQLRVHLDRLVTLDYMAMHGGKQGQQYTYSLLFDGDPAQVDAQLSGLGIALSEAPAEEPTSRGPGATSRGKSSTSRGSDPHFAGGSRGDSGGVAAPSRGAETGRNASNGAGSASLLTALSETPRSRTGKMPRRNGDASPGVTR